MSSTRSPRVALITGGNRGLGRSIAIHLAQKGVSIIFTYNSHPEEGEAVVKELQALGVKAACLQFDTTAFDKYESFHDEFTKILSSWSLEKFDIIIPSAGVGLPSLAGKTEANTLDQLYEIHFKSPYLLVQMLLPQLNDKTSAVITISTGLARFANTPWGAYSSMKAAVENWTRYLAKEIGPRGIRAICCRVGAVESDFGGGVVRDNKDANAQIAKVTAMGRVGRPDDIGETIAGVVDLPWVTGTTIEMSGGQAL